MRLVLCSLAAAVAVATPALANEGRVEARGGVAWGGGSSEAFAGIAAGYDFDLGSSAFAGVEVSGDKILDAASNRVGVGFTGRLGGKLGAGKLYANGGYTTKFCDTCDDTWHAGAGYEHGFGGNLYGKIEYRHYFVDLGTDVDIVGVGLGLKF